MKSYAKRVLERFERITSRKKLDEEAMTLDRALGIFGLEEIPSPKELGALHKKLALKNHPDRGGSVEKMAEINAAYDFLKESPVGQKKSSGYSDFSSAFNDLFNYKKGQKSGQNRYNIFVKAQETAKEIKAKIKSTVLKISKYLSKSYEDITGESIRIKSEVRPDNINNLISCKGVHEFNSIFRDDDVKFGYYVLFSNEEKNIEIYMGIREIIGVSVINRKQNKTVIRRTKAELESASGAKVYLGVTNSGDILVNPEIFYSNPEEYFEGKSLNRLFNLK